MHNMQKKPHLLETLDFVISKAAFEQTHILTSFKFKLNLNSKPWFLLHILDEHVGCEVVVKAG